MSLPFYDVLRHPPVTIEISDTNFLLRVFFKLEAVFTYPKSQLYHEKSQNIASQ